MEPELQKIYCHARAGQRLSYGRLPGRPIIGPEPAEYTLPAITVRQLRQDGRIVMLDADAFAARHAEIARLAEKRASAAGSGDSATDAAAPVVPAEGDTKPEGRRRRKPRGEE